MNAIIYTRCSPRPARDLKAKRAAANVDNESIRLQIDDCERYALMKSLNIIKTINDPETSARKTPLFERAGGSQLKVLPRGTHIICSNLDRMFRSAADGLMTINYFKQQGIILHFADQFGCTLDLTTYVGEFLLTMLLATAAYEADNTAESTSAAMKRRQANGQRMTSRKSIPFGQKVDPIDSSRTIPCDMELAAAARALDLQRKGTSLRKIAKELGPIRGKILSPSSVNLLISKAQENGSP